MELTLCLIVKNEELKLSTCLSSFQGLFQKLVIVDTGSTDHTKKIAKQFGAQIYDFSWQADFSSARNFALSKVQTPLVMMVDADDQIELSSLQKIKQALQSLPDHVNGIFLPYLYSAVQQGQGIMAYLPRIWRTSKQYKYTLPVHEYLDISRKDLDNFLRLPFPIIHHKDPNNLSQSYSRNLDILKQAYLQDPSQRRIVFYLGHDHQYAGNYQEAIKWYKTYTDLGNTQQDELHKAYLGQGICYIQLGEISEAKKALKKAIKANPNFIDPYLHLGEMAIQEHHYEQAVQIYFKTLHFQPPLTHVFVNTHLYNGFAQKKLTQALQALEKN